MSPTFSTPSLQLAPIRITQLPQYPVATLVSLSDLLPIVRVSNVTTSKVTVAQLRATIIKDINVPSLTSTFISNTTLHSNTITASSLSSTFSRSTSLVINDSATSNTAPRGQLLLTPPTGQSDPLPIQNCAVKISVKQTDTFDVPLLITSEKNGAPYFINSSTFSNYNVHNVIRCFSAGGTIDSPTAIMQDTALFTILTCPYNGVYYNRARFSGSASIAIHAEGDQTPSNAGSSIRFSTTQIDTETEAIERVRITDDGKLLVGTTTSTSNSATKLCVAGNISAAGYLVLEGSTAHPSEIFSVDVVEETNRTNTYLTLRPAGSVSDWALLRQIGPANQYHLALDLHDDNRLGGTFPTQTFSIRNVGSSNPGSGPFVGSNTDIITPLLHVTSTTTDPSVTPTKARVGIGTSNPQDTLDVNGGLTVRGDVSIESPGKLTGDGSGLSGVKVVLEREITYATGTNEYTIVHNFNQRNIYVQVWEEHSNHNELVLVGVRSYDNHCVISFGTTTASLSSGDVFKVLLVR